jgi:molecular chaperone Hsp33
MGDKLIRGIVRGAGGAVGARVVAAVTTDVVAEAGRRHGMRPAGTIALGRAATAGLLFATLSKSAEERVTLQILGDGPLGSVTVDADGAGAVRGFVRNPAAPLATGQAGRVSLRSVVGQGEVAVIRDLGSGTMYRGSTTLASGEIDEDLEAYLGKSEQVESALGCDVVLGDDGAVRAAGGLLVQCLPGGDVAAVAAVRERLRGGAVHRALTEGVRDAAVLARLVVGSAGAVEPLDEGPVFFRCSCSRERVTSALALCGAAELRAMIDEDGGAEVTCNFCRQSYRLDPADLARMLESMPQA